MVMVDCLHYMLCANYEFAQSMDCPVQSNDRYFVQQTMDWLLCSILWITSAFYGLPTLLFAQSMDLARYMTSF